MDLYNPCHDRLGRFVASMVWNDEEAKDIISETVLITLEKFDKIKDERSFLYYLFGVAIRLIRKRKRKGWKQLLFGDDAWESFSEKESYITNSDTEDLNTLLGILDEKPREAIVLFEISGFSIKEVSALQNCSQSAVKSRLVRARKTLKDACEIEKKAITLKAVKL